MASGPGPGPGPEVRGEPREAPGVGRSALSLTFTSSGDGHSHSSRKKKSVFLKFVRGSVSESQCVLLPRPQTRESSAISDSRRVVDAGEAAAGLRRPGQGGGRDGDRPAAGCPSLPLLIREPPPLASSPVPTWTAPFPGSWQRGGLPKELCPRAPARSWAGGRPSAAGLTGAHASVHSLGGEREDGAPSSPRTSLCCPVRYLYPASHGRDVPGS